VAVANQGLERFGCAVQVKKFEPTALPALFQGSDVVLLGRSIEETSDQSAMIFSAMLDELKEALPSGPSHRAALCLNFSNEVIRRLASSGHGAYLLKAIEVLYVHSLLMAHYPLGEEELSMLQENLIELIGFGLDPETSVVH
jgi:molecular chaperone HtpG